MRGLRGRVLGACGWRPERPARVDGTAVTTQTGVSTAEVPMARGRRVCPWGCSGGKGEVDVLGAERVEVPGAASTAALVRCAECQRISIAGR